MDLLWQVMLDRALYANRKLMEIKSETQLEEKNNISWAETLHLDAVIRQEIGRNIVNTISVIIFFFSPFFW